MYVHIVQLIVHIVQRPSRTEHCLQCSKFLVRDVDSGKRGDEDVVVWVDVELVADLSAEAECGKEHSGGGVRGAVVLVNGDETGAHDSPVGGGVGVMDERGKKGQDYGKHL